MTVRSSDVFDDTEVPRESRSSSASPTISLFDIKRIVILRLPVFLVTCAIAAAILAPLAWLVTPVTYTAEAEIRFLSVRPRILEPSAGSSVAVLSYEKFVNTQAALIEGQTILSRVLNHPDAQRVGELNAAGDKLAFLSDRVRARQNTGTELVTVECTMKAPSDARQILQTVVDEYLSYAYTAEAAAGGERLRVLVAERDKREKDLQSLVEELNTRKSALGVSIDETAADPASTAASQYRESLIRAEEELSALQLDLTNQREKAAGTGGAAAGQLNASLDRDVETDPRVMSLFDRLITAKSQLVTAKARYREGSPQLREYEREITSIELQIAETKGSVRQELREAKIQEAKDETALLEQKVAEASDRVDRYKELLAENERDLERRNAELIGIQQLQDEVAQRRTLIDELSSQITGLSLESQAPAQVQLASEASVPSNAGYGGKMTSVLLAFILAGGLGVGVAGVMELRDTKLHTSHDIERFSSAPVIASIPFVTEDHAHDSAEPLILALARSNSIFADQLRRIFTSVIYPTRDSSYVNSLLVTSPTVGDGKTTLACSLAAALAEASRRVLLVDLSHRKPDVERRFGLEPAVGLSDFLDGTCRFEEVVRKSPSEKLYLVGPGKSSHDLSNRLISERMIEFQGQAEEAFTHVVFDCPPALLMSDAYVVAPRVDGVILVVGAETSNRGMVMRCLRDMERINAVVLGIVLNGVKPMRGGYFKQRHDLHHHYGDTPDIAKSDAAKATPPPQPHNGAGQPTASSAALNENSKA